MSRPRVLQRIRRACGSNEGVVLPQGFPGFPRFEDRVGVFRKELEAVGGVFFDGRSQDLGKILTKILQDTGQTEIYWEEEKIFSKHGLSYRLRLPELFSTPKLVCSYHYLGKVVLPLTLGARSHGKDQLARIQISASSASFGIAETGTVVQTVGSGRGRLLTVLPESHVVFLAEADLFSSPDEVFSRVRLGEDGSALTLTTGPSRTADIGKVLVKGVHGPRRWFVILTE